MQEGLHPLCNDADALFTKKIVDALSYMKNGKFSEARSAAKATSHVGILSLVEGCIVLLERRIHTSQAVSLLERAISSPNMPSTVLADAFGNLGVAYCRRGQFLQAINAFRRAIEIHPQDIFKFNRAKLFFQLQHFDSVIRELDSLSNSKFRDAILLKASALLNMQKWLEAAEILPKDSSHYELAKKKHLEHLSSVSAIFSESHSSASNSLVRAERYCRAGWKHYQARLYDNASELFMKAINQNPSNPDSLFGLGEIEYTLGKGVKACHYFYAYLREVGEDPAAIDSRAEAIFCLTTMLNCVGLHDLSLSCLGNQKGVNESLLKRGYDAPLIRSWILGNKGDVVAAKKEFNQSLQSSRISDLGLLVSVLLCIRSQDAAGAWKCLGALKKQMGRPSPVVTAQMYFFSGLLLHCDGRTEAAMSCYLSAIDFLQCPGSIFADVIQSNLDAAKKGFCLNSGMNASLLFFGSSALLKSQDTNASFLLQTLKLQNGLPAKRSFTQAPSTEAVCRVDFPKISNLRDFGKLLDTWKNCIVFVGAGISVSAGIPDFRSPGGLYDQIAQKFKLQHPEYMFDLTYFLKDPSLFYSFARDVFPRADLEPTFTHYFLAFLERRGIVRRVYTQNLDDLEHRAGVSSIFHCHGSFRSFYCLTCCRRFRSDEIQVYISARQVPYCSHCGQDSSDISHGLLKPSVTFFSEKLNSDMETLFEHDVQSADGCIVIGSSCSIAPVSDMIGKLPGHIPIAFMNLTRVSCPRKGGFNVELIGKSDTICSSLCRAMPWKLPSCMSLEDSFDLNFEWKSPSNNLLLFEGSSSHIAELREPYSPISFDHEVESIVDSKKTGENTEFLVKWKSFPNALNEWLPESELKSAQGALKLYQDSLRAREQTHVLSNLSPLPDIEFGDNSCSGSPLDNYGTEGDDEQEISSIIEEPGVAPKPESIQDRRFNKDGVEEFRVRWIGCSSEFDSWLPSNAIPRFQDHLNAFEVKQSAKSSTTAEDAERPSSASSSDITRQDDNAESTMKEPSNVEQALVAPEEEYEVESIVDKRIVNGQVEYLVKWKGFPSEENTFEPAEGLDGCIDLVHRFEKELAKKKSSRKASHKRKRLVRASKFVESDESISDAEKVNRRQSNTSREKAEKDASLMSLRSSPQKISSGNATMGEVDDILDARESLSWVRGKEFRETSYLVKWKGANQDYQTWEKENDLNCPDLIEQFKSQRDAMLKQAEQVNGTPSKRSRRLILK